MFVQFTKAFLGNPAGEGIEISEDDARSAIAQQLAVLVTDNLITPAVSKALESAFSKFKSVRAATVRERFGSTAP
jgi:hypothetical protein